jgi:hypothetical protein
MTQAQAQVVPGGHQIQPLTGRFIAGAGMGEMLGGGAAVVLSIVALAGILPNMLLPIAGLCVGGALLFEGGSIASRYRDLLHKYDSRLDLAELGGGLSAEFLGGAAGIALSLLGVLGVHPLELMAVAAIVFGATLIVGAGATAELKSLTLPFTEGHEQIRLIARQAISTAAGLRVLMGMGAVALGILALVNAAPSETLSLVSFLALGGTVLLSGTAIGGKMLAIFQH